MTLFNTPIINKDGILVSLKCSTLMDGVNTQVCGLIPDKVFYYKVFQ